MSHLMSHSFWYIRWNRYNDLHLSARLEDRRRLHAKGKLLRKKQYPKSFHSHNFSSQARRPHGSSPFHKNVNLLKANIKRFYKIRLISDPLISCIFMSKNLPTNSRMHCLLNFLYIIFHKYYV